MLVLTPGEWETPQCKVNAGQQECGGRTAADSSCSNNRKIVSNYLVNTEEHLSAKQPDISPRRTPTAGEEQGGSFHAHVNVNSSLSPGKPAPRPIREQGADK
ncbi:unnamed protein product [Pleuronectes platessa]|uniref:Uncharacterized protein n=1 Tax=Pleuronectes platessa TaxID=8262 RepID=A0A9N7TGG8_PLEPL|nr:unnamed protein product [Pleuronectes platessa]